MGQSIIDLTRTTVRDSEGMGNARKSGARNRQDTSLNRVIAGRYRLEARVGEGGMGVVYRARHILIDRVVAVKLIRPDLRGETHLRAWMLREARAANRVDHAHIIDIQDIGETDEGELYLVMEYLVGTALSSAVGRGPFSIRRAVDVLEQMIAALARAHDLGVVHRDLKSDNILLTSRGGQRDFVKILDFGLAALAHDPRLAPKGAVFGTPEYMAPEQARGEQAGPPSDLYATGVLFFEMLTGRLPFRAGDRDSLLEMQRSGKPPKPTALRKDCHPVAEQICLKLLEKDPRKRYRDGHHLLEDLKALQRSLPDEKWQTPASQDAPAASPAPRQKPVNVTDWATHAGLYSRMLARAYAEDETPSTARKALEQLWALAAKTNTLEGRITGETKRVEALERRGHSMKAEIGRMVEELAAEESRMLRTASELAQEEAAARSAVERAEEFAHKCLVAADEADAEGRGTRDAFERVGAASARVHAKRQWQDSYRSKREEREARARDLRRQIEELRGQLARFLDELEQDLAKGRERVAEQARLGIRCEKEYRLARRELDSHLTGKPECRELMAEMTGPPSDERAAADPSLASLAALQASAARNRTA